MYVAKAKGLFMLDGCTPEKKGLPQRARWRWHAGFGRCANCEACVAGMPMGRWWTDSEARVSELARLVAATPGEPELEIGDEGLAARVKQELRQREGQGDWLSRLEERDA